MKYVVLMNGKYMNTSKSYSDACDVREMLETKFKNAIIEIITTDMYEKKMRKIYARSN